MIAYTIAKERLNSKSVEEAVEKTINHLVGAFSLIVMSPQKLIAARDPWGFRPLCMGKKGDGYCFSRKLVHLTVWVRNLSGDIEPGEIVVVQDGKISTIRTHVAKSHIQCVSLNTYILHVLTVLLKDSLHTIHVCLQANTWHRNFLLRLTL